MEISAQDTAEDLRRSSSGSWTSGTTLARRSPASFEPHLVGDAAAFIEVVQRGRDPDSQLVQAQVLAFHPRQAQPFEIGAHHLQQRGLKAVSSPGSMTCADSARM